VVSPCMICRAAWVVSVMFAAPVRVARPSGEGVQVAAMLRVPLGAVTQAVKLSPWGSPCSCRETAVPHGLACREAEPEADTPAVAISGVPSGGDEIWVCKRVAPNSTATMVAADRTVARRQRRSWVTVLLRAAATVLSARLSTVGGTVGVGWRTWSMLKRDISAGRAA